MKTKTKLRTCFVCILSIALGARAGAIADSAVFADNPQTITFSARVLESLSVTIDQSLTASGNVGDLLTNSFTITVNTNNNDGFVASMYSTDSTSLTHDSITGATGTIETLTSSIARASVPVNRWGYSLDDITYSPMTTSANPIAIASSQAATASDVSKTVYFGVKADTSKAAGSYSNNVTVNVVSPYAATPTVPENPNTPSQDTDQTNNTATYVSETNTSVYVKPSNTNQTQIISGNYTAPLGVTESTYYTTSSTSGGSSLVTGLAVASATAAVSGGFFFILSKFRRDDDDEEE